MLDALVKETGRHYSGNLDVRWARKDKTLRNSDVTIAAGAIVSISPYLTHHDPETWTNPDSYYPERWIEQPGLVQELNDGTQLRYIPFGAGSHRCPGEKMATMLAKTVVATMVQNAELEWGTGGAAQDTTSLDFSKVGSPWLKGDVHVVVKSN
jgi:sterol 14-demethylase